MDLIKKDEWMMDLLRAVQSLSLPDCWVCAGFVRSKVWDALHGFEKRTPLQDVDVVYFDADNTDWMDEKNMEQSLRTIKPDVPWSVKNQARMHIRNGDSPYRSSTEAISKFTETATAVGVHLDSEDNLVLTAPSGIEDLIHLVVRPTQYIIDNVDAKGKAYEERVMKKKWEAQWYKLTIVHVL
ncbi:nucleotidyltransferase family protein [Cohnella faecalis]|nr:nucleotidyltransferase family protein [Cohnella faecalis]